MTMEKAKALPVIADWLETNNSQLTEIRDQNPELYGAMFSALNYLNNYLGATKTLEPHTAIKIQAPIVTTPTTILELDWIIINRITGGTNDILTTYQFYKDAQGQIAYSSYISDLISFFGTSYWIMPSDKDYVKATELFKLPNLLSFPVPIFRFVIEPKYRTYFKNSKKRLDNLNRTQEEGFCLIAKNEKDFYESLIFYLKEDLLFNSLSIPDIIRGKIIPTQQEAEFEELADELDNLEI